MRLSFLLLTASVLTGCAASHLVYVQETSLGVSVSAGGEGSQKISIGYDRDVGAVVPKKGDKSDAMALLSINETTISGINNICTSQFVASGAPAITLATNEDAVTTLRDKFYAGDAVTTCGDDGDQPGTTGETPAAVSTSIGEAR